MVIALKTRNKLSLFPSKEKTSMNLVLSIKEIVFVVHVILVKPNVMQKLHNNPTKSSESSKHL